MRNAIIGIMLGYGFMAAVTPAFACPYTQASSGQAAPQQTASIQDAATTTAH